jgi:hypothetical protein
MADRVECDKGLVMRGRTNRADKRTPLANADMTWWRRIDIGVKDNGPGCLIIYMVGVGVILIGQRGSDT